MINKRPKILITNDDGIHAPGIRHLWETLKNVGDLFLIAPATEQSGSGLAITIRNPLNLQKVFWPENGQAWAVNGTPADCVKMGLNVILNENPDLVISGINRGSNAGRSLLYSGTVAAAIEGIMHNIPSIAFSCCDYVDPDYQAVTDHVSTVVRYILAHPLPTGTLLNVNFPEKVRGLKGLKMTRQGLGYWAEDPHERKHPGEGHSYFWLGAKLAEFDEHAESDITWLKKGYAAAVPVHVAELTDHNHLASSKEHFEKFLLT